MKPHHHACGIEHHNIHAEQGFSALIVVDTPSVDDSGVSHAVEHLVFRRSEAFNREESLFQLTALSDLSVNASTHASVTYYHCQSQCLQTCLLGLNYLLNGVLAPNFLEQDLRYEIYHNEYYGVINRELRPQQTDQQRFIDRSDTSAQRCYQYGGDTDLISQLDLNDVVRYHAQCYQAKKMRLITGNIEPTLVASILDSIDCKEEISATYSPKAFCESNDYEPNKQILRWWVSGEFFAYFSTHHKNLSLLVASHNAQLMPPKYSLNNHQQFALDVIAPINCSEDVLYQALTKYLENNAYEASIKGHENRQYKFSPEIIRLVNYHQAITPNSASDLSQKIKKQIPLSLTRATHFRLQKQQIKHQQIDKPIPLLPVKNRLLVQLLHHVSKGNHQQIEYKHRPLPNVFKPLLVKAQQQLIQNPTKIAKVFDEEHCLMLFDIKASEENLAIITSFIISAYPSFLASRTQGHCYAIVCQYLVESRHLAFYSAFDVAPRFRLTTIPETLVSLNKDRPFIAASLPLAKTKFKNIYRNDITTDSVAKFMSKELLINDV